MKNMLKTLLSDAVLMSAFITAASLLFLASAYTAEYGFGLKPCILCLYQRIPYAITALLGLIALFFAKKAGKPEKAAFIIFIAALVFFGESGLAFYHVGVEQHWWTSAFEACKVDFNGDAKDLLESIMNTQAVRCDEIPWQMFGISMAGYNVMAAFGMAIVSILASIFILRKKNGVL